MKITSEEFREYWNKEGRFLFSDNEKRTCDNMSAVIDDVKSSEDLDEYVFTCKKGRETVRKIVVSFYEFLNKKHDREQIISNLYERKYIDNTIERQFEIAKFLHVPRTKFEIEEKFGLSEATRKRDLRELEKGISFLGAKVKITKTRKGGKDYYKSTMHPVFLPLNLTELYAITVYLQRKIKPGDVNGMVISNVINRIQTQLSDYAFEKLFPKETKPEIENIYREDEWLANQREGIYGYLMKMGFGTKIKFIWDEKEYEGSIDYDNESGEYRAYVDGKPLDAKLEDIDIILESLNYE